MGSGQGQPTWARLLLSKWVHQYYKRQIGGYICEGLQEQFQQQLFNGSIQRCSPNLSFQKRKPLVTKINLKSGLELFFPPLFQENFRNVIFKICHVFNDISHLNIQFWRVQSSKQLSIHWNWNHWRVELENFWNLDFNHDGNLFTFVSVPKMLPTLYWQE